MFHSITRLTTHRHRMMATMPITAVMMMMLGMVAHQQTPSWPLSLISLVRNQLRTLLLRALVASKVHNMLVLMGPGDRRRSYAVVFFVVEGIVFHAFSMPICFILGCSPMRCVGTDDAP